jgi:hypothetical protein
VNQNQNQGGRPRGPPSK